MTTKREKFTRYGDCFDEYAEKGLIGFILSWGREGYEMVARCLRKEDFHDERLALAFSCCKHMRKIDMWTMTRAMSCIKDDGFMFWFKECFMMDVAYSQIEADNWLEHRWDGDYTYREEQPPDRALRLAKKIHALATLRRIWVNWHKIAEIAFCG